MEVSQEFIIMWDRIQRAGDFLLEDEVLMHDLMVFYYSTDSLDEYALLSSVIDDINDTLRAIR